MSAPLAKIGKYNLLAKLAVGGMGEIFLAQLQGERGFEKLVVVKRLLPALVAEEQFVTMFLHEARIAAQLSHTNICDVYELGRADGQYFIAMQHLLGVPFSAVMKAHTGADEVDHLRLCAGLLQQACEGLYHAHQLEDHDGNPLHLVHRDVSPSNLFVTVDGVLKVLDFGIAKAQNLPSNTSKGTIKGKVAYMSPEQVRGEPLDHRSDIYALGVVLFEAMTRRRLHDQESEFLVAQAILEESVPLAHQLAPAVPPAMSAVIQQATSRDREERFGSARALAVAIGNAAAGLGGALTVAEIGDRIAAAFATELAEQRELCRRALRGDQAAVADTPLGVDRETASFAPPPVDPSAATQAERPLALAGERRRHTGLYALLGAAALAALAAGYYFGIGADRGGAPTAATADAGPLDAGPLDAGPGDAGPGDAPPGDTGLDAGQTAGPGAIVHATSKPGYFSIDSTPYATIYIDGREISVTPIIREPVTPGRHRVRAVLEDGRERSFSIDVKSGRLTHPRQLYW